MYDFHDNAEYLVHEGSFDLEPDFPEPLEHWSLRDFGDILPAGSHVAGVYGEA